MPDIYVRRKTVLRFALMVLLAAVSSTHPRIVRAQTVLPSDAQTTCTVTPTVFAGWFKGGTVVANGEVLPADSVNFPDQPNCTFYQWSEQMFLWLTSPTPRTYGGGGSRIFNSAAFFDVSPPDQGGDRTLVAHKNTIIRPFSIRAAQFGPHGTPIIFDKRGRMFDVLRSPSVANGPSLVRNSAGEQIEVEDVRGEPGRKATFVEKSGRTIEFDARATLAAALESQRSPQLVPEAREQPDPRRMGAASARFLRERDRAAIAISFVNRAGKVFFLDQNGNIIDVEQGQAVTDGVLLAQNGSLIYFASMVNDVFAYLLTGTKNGGITPTPTKFPTTQAELDKIVDFAQANGRTFPDPEALAIEVKTAWVEPTGLDTSKYVTITANIPTYDTSKPSQWTATGQKQATLAMVGMHVVGSTKGHPEMIWSTFEHVGNTPNGAYSYVNTANQTISVPQNTAGTWLFSASNSTGPFNVQRMFFSAPHIVATTGNTIGPSDTIRWKAWGAAADLAPNPLVTTAQSNSEIISINNSVIGQLAAGDIRKNYIMTGSTWTIGGAAPSSGNQVGTSRSANTTMETYDQGSSPNAAGSSNCFTCHNTNTFAVSHFFDDLKPLF